MKLLSYLFFTFLIISTFSLSSAQEDRKSNNEIIYDSLVSVLKSNSNIINEMISDASLESDSSAMILHDLINLNYNDIKSKYKLNSADETDFIAAISVTTEIIELNKLIYNKLDVTDSFSEMYSLKSIDQKSNDSIIEIDYDLFQAHKLDLKTIPKEQFESYLSPLVKGKYINDCSLYDLNLKPGRDHDQIGVTYIMEHETHKRMYLPEDYDNGISGASFAPNCLNLIIYSSYDGPDYNKYYENRAEFYVFKIVGNDGLSSIQPSLRFSLKDWSIENLVWISDNEIGLKLYSEARVGDGSHLKHKYFRASLSEKEK